MKSHNKNRGRIRPIHKRIALHTSSLLLLLGGGFLPLPVQSFGQTYTVDVSAKVSAPIPTDPAIITSPQDGQHLTDPTITVSGTCPDSTYVKVFNGSQLAGVGMCNGGTFSVQVTLSPGANTLRAQVYNLTDDAGPSSPAITVYYDPPATPTTPSNNNGSTGSGSTSAEGAGGDGLSLDIPYTFSIKNTNDVWEWDVLIEGGKAPYRVTIDWGDGTIEQLQRTDRSLFTIRHAYTHQGTHQPLISVLDAANHGASLQLIAEVRERPSPIIQFLRSIFGDIIDKIGPWIMWPLYILICAAIGLFWAFELRAFKRHLQQKRRATRHHA